MDPTCRLDVERTGDDAVVRVAGELDAAGSRMLRTCLSSLADAGVRRMRVDACRLSFLDAAGLGVLIGAARRMQSSGGEFRLEAPTRQVSRVLALTGATAALGIVGE